MVKKTGTFDNMVCVVTGGTRGIGAAIAKGFAEQGANVIISYSANDEDAQRTFDEIKRISPKKKSAIFKASVGDYDIISSMFRNIRNDIGPVDILINNAGITRDAYLMLMKNSSWDEVINVNLTGMYNCCKCVTKDFIRRKKGVIINISSVSALVGMAGQTNYAAAKAGIIGFTKALAKELSPSGIRVNCVAPGLVESEILNTVPSNTLRELTGLIALRRVGLPEEIAATVLFLAGDGASYITGQVITVDGGLTMF